MPNNKSAEKRLRTSEKERIRNKSRISALKTFEKKFRSALTSTEKDNAKELLSVIFTKLDKAVKCGTIHKNKAANKKSQLSKLLNTV